MPILTPKDRSGTNLPPSSMNKIIGLFKCYNFLSPNEYSDRTNGLLAFLLRKSVGEINFSDVFDEIIKGNQQGKRINIVALLEEKRKTLSEIDASIEKCLMINRLISYIQEDQARFMSMISYIQTEMKTRMTDDHQNPIIQYPEDFRQRERDFHKRKDAQDMRHLFYYSPNEAKAPSIMHLQNRTTEHLNHLINTKMRFDPNFRDTGIIELENIFRTSFMIIAQPHFGVNPVLIHEREKPGIYTARVSVIIISLLHDFMQTHPNMIQFCDIELNLLPSSKFYKLDESQKLSWEICQLQINPNEKPRTIQYAELKGITIHQLTSKNTSLHFSEGLHSFYFSITLRVNISEHKISRIYRIPLESLPFAISSHHNHTSYLLTKVIIDHIQRFSQFSSINTNTILNFILRYFIHRTGVEPKPDLRNYLEKELNKAKNEKINYQSLEDIYMDFLVEFVHQVEFMAKHPILAMFYADGLFLGPCDSELAAEVITQSSDVNSSIVGLRFDTISVDYKPIVSTPASSKSMKLPSPFIRVDIYNTRIKQLQKYTFDSLILINDICKFVSTANAKKASYIRILSNFDDERNDQIFYKDFIKYYHVRLHEILKTNRNYKHITNLLLDIEDDDGDSHVNENQNIDSSEMSVYSIPDAIHSASMATTNHEDDSNGTNGYKPIPYNESSQNVFLVSDRQPLELFNDQDVIQYVISRPNLFVELIRHFRHLQVSTATILAQQQQLQMPFPNQQTLFSYQQQSSSTPFQTYPQTSYPPQQQIFNQQRSSSIMLNQATSINLCQQRNGIQTSSQQHPIETQIFQIPENVLAPSNPSFNGSDVTDQILSKSTDEYEQLFPSDDDQ